MQGAGVPFDETALTQGNFQAVSLDWLKTNRYEWIASNETIPNLICSHAVWEAPEYGSVPLFCAWRNGKATPGSFVAISDSNHMTLAVTSAWNRARLGITGEVAPESEEARQTYGYK